MILHDTCSVVINEVIDNLDTTTPRTASLGAIQCEVNPLDSTVGAETGIITTRYTFFTTADLITAFEAQVAAWAASYNKSKGGKMVVTYRGKTLTFAAGLEVHRVLGRFHHIEAIVKDYGVIGV